MDQDESMISSPASPTDQDESTFTHPDEDQDPYQDQDLFPPGTTNTATSAAMPRPQTPQNNHLNAAAPGELSPPRSQDQTQTQPQTQSHAATVPSRNRTNAATRMAGTTTTNTDDTAASTDVTATTSAAVAAIGGDGANSTRGYTAGSWKTSKSQDEMSKVWETSYVDRDFNVAAFGDPLGHVVPRGTAQGQQDGDGSGRGDGGGGGWGADRMAVFRGALGM